MRASVLGSVLLEGWGESGTATVIYPTSFHQSDSASGYAQVIMHLTNSLQLKQAFAKKWPSALVYTAECTLNKQASHSAREDTERLQKD